MNEPPQTLPGGAGGGTAPTGDVVTDLLSVRLQLPVHAGIGMSAYTRVVGLACDQLLKRYWPRLEGLPAEDWPPVMVRFYYDEDFFCDGVEVRAEVPRVGVG